MDSKYKNHKYLINKNEIRNALEQAATEVLGYKNQLRFAPSFAIVRMHNPDLKDDQNKILRKFFDRVMTLIDED